MKLICFIAFFIITTEAAHSNIFANLLHGAAGLIDNLGNGIDLAAHCGLEDLGKVGSYGLNILDRGITGIANGAAHYIPILHGIANDVDKVTNTVDYLGNNGLEDAGSALQSVTQAATGLVQNLGNNIANDCAPVKPASKPAPKPAPTPSSSSS